MLLLFFFELGKELSVTRSVSAWSEYTITPESSRFQLSQKQYIFN